MIVMPNASGVPPRLRLSVTYPHQTESGHIARLHVYSCQLDISWAPELKCPHFTCGRHPYFKIHQRWCLYELLHSVVKHFIINTDIFYIHCGLQLKSKSKAFAKMSRLGCDLCRSVVFGALEPAHWEELKNATFEAQFWQIGVPA